MLHGGGPARRYGSEATFLVSPSGNGFGFKGAELMVLAPPVLRSPLFPGVAMECAAVSLAKDIPFSADLTRKDDHARAVALAASIVASRIGGSFWAPPPDMPAAFRSLLCPASAEAVAPVADRALGRVAAGELLALLPDTSWAADARRALERRGIAVLTGAVDPWPLLAKATEIDAGGNDELAFLALLAGLTVRCHADGAFAGHGLTRDDPEIAPKRPMSVAQLAAMILIDGADYRDCYTGAAVDAEDAVAQLGFWRRLTDANRGVAAGAGIAIWKRREVAAMLWAERPKPLRFFQRAATAVQAAREGVGAVAVWPSRAPDGLEQAAAAAGVPLWRVEDGFIRSVGLGSACHPPMSIILDRQGIYFDPTAPSDLEAILAGADFPPELTARAERLAADVVAAGISKYAVGRGGFVASGGAGRRRVLVPGQVEDDLSVRLGGGEVRGNLDLLARVRAAEPDAWILFKPHPDVDAGHRAGHVADERALAYADEIVRDVAMAPMLDGVDAVHVLTSLTGFEALLRGREVVTHGVPFYAGWGLTRDLAGPFPRRGRTLTLGELVAGALILYPRYLDPVTLLPCPPEVLIARLSEQSVPRPTWLTRIRGVQGRLRQPRRLAGSPA